MYPSEKAFYEDLGRAIGHTWRANNPHASVGIAAFKPTLEQIKDLLTIPEEFRPYFSIAAYKASRPDNQEV